MPVSTLDSCTTGVAAVSVGSVGDEGDVTADVDSAGDGTAPTPGVDPPHAVSVNALTALITPSTIRGVGEFSERDTGSHLLIVDGFDASDAVLTWCVIRVRRP
jgi:hypothetical protein